jgi:hypothetical protein
MESSNRDLGAAKALTFLPSFQTTFLWIMSVAFPVACVWRIGSLITSGRHFVLGRYLRSMTFGLLVAAVMLALLLLIARKFYAVKLSWVGVVGYNFWGSGLLMPWEEIGVVRPFSMLGLKYLRLYSQKAGPTVWVPLFVVPRASFRASLLELAPTDSPIRAHF